MPVLSRARGAAWRFRRRIRASASALLKPPLYPTGHFYSPLLGAEDVRTEVRSKASEPRWIDLEPQLAFVQKTAQAVAAAPHAHGGGRFQEPNGWFRVEDALALHSIVATFRPAQVIEVGSGWSTAALLDSCEALGLQTRITAIDPYPERLHLVLREYDGVEILEERVQDVEIALFRRLQRDDLLIIDSSHVVKAGSDVVHLLTTVLPELTAGVVVHFHDVFWPFTYPAEWLAEGRCWNEVYALNAFLVGARDWEILLFNSMLAAKASNAVADAWPGWKGESPASLWIRRLDSDINQRARQRTTGGN
jgi:predicted O-methyltransferase YrrM